MPRRDFLLVAALLSWLAPAPAADVGGQWRFKAISPDGEDPAQLTITQHGEKITGVFDSVRGQHNLQGTVKGSEIRFTVRYDGPEGAMEVPFEGRLEGDKMRGQFKAGEVTGAWSAERAR